MLKTLAVLLWLVACPALADEIITHQLSVALTPQQHHMQVEDILTLPATSPPSLTFTLHKDLPPTTTTPGVRIHRQDLQPEVGVVHYTLTRPVNVTRVVLHYQGVIHHALDHINVEQARGYRNTQGLIDPQGVYLTADSYWYPQFAASPQLRFELTVQLPTGWRAISQGEPVGDGWAMRKPQQEIYLIAGPLVRYQQSGRVLAQVYLRHADAALAQRYLSATQRYLQMYETLLGEYPYAKFALIENFWETGFGMPSFTLLGEKIIRFPFILYSSYPHEILHNWWGNGVFPDLTQGNWSEGLTAYLADHLFKEFNGADAQYRRESLQKYTDYTAHQKDFALSAFRSRHSSVSEAVGYGKTLMLFHMLRQRLGAENFILGLREFYQRYQFNTASFDDIRQVFEYISGQQLSGFFQQWVQRVGAPVLRLSKVDVSKQPEHYVLSVELTQQQAGDAYQLRVPIAVTLAQQEQAIETVVAMQTKQQTFQFTFTHQPTRVDVDPQFDLFRKLDQQETPAALTAMFAAPQLLVLLPSAAPPAQLAAYRTFARSMANMGPKQVVIKLDSDIEQLPQQPVVLLGWRNRLRQVMTTALGAQRAQIDTQQLTIGTTLLEKAEHTVVLTARHNQRPITWIATTLPDALPGLARKLPHYHKYSYLAFRGNEPSIQHKGRWQVDHSPMSVSLVAHTQAAKLTPRKPLTQLPTPLDAQRMLQHVQTLSAPQMTGRGLGQPGLTQAATYIAEQFAQAGLQPAGEDNSFFQTWTQTTGPEQQSILLKNVLAVLPAAQPTQQSVVLAAHYDHLGRGWPDVRQTNQGRIHPGADDNASGVAVLLELARVLRATYQGKRNIVFVAFTGEEAGRLGSQHYIKQQQAYPLQQMIAMLNLDTVGRLHNKPLLALGAASSPQWPHILRGVEYVTGVKLQPIANLATASDQQSFIDAGIPALQLFSGAHADYHRPSDTADKIDAPGLLRVAKVSQEILTYLADREAPLTLGASIPTTHQTTQPQVPRKVSLGTIPDFTYQQGYRISGVTPGSPAEQAGLHAGDVITQFGAFDIHHLRDFSDALKQTQPGDRRQLVYQRAGQTHTVEVVLAAK